jgi:AraC-like DNA-binding protein
METIFLPHTTDPVAAGFPMELLQEKQQEIPNAIQYTIRRYRKPPEWQSQHAAQLVYHYGDSVSREQYVQLKFCMVTNEYCNEKQQNCDFCKQRSSAHCSEIVPTVDFINIQFSANHLKQFFSSKQNSTFFEKLIRFGHTESFTTPIGFTSKIVSTLQNILNHSYTGSFENIYFNAQTQMLLLFCFESVNGLPDQPFQCKFLFAETEREKILQARDILIAQIGEPLTIRALSRKVAINECYLKKGFKELFGQTIFDFYQSQRMEHAKYLLYTLGLSVTAVSEKLGYSSISHFSTAFKKLTGIKPCELLLR